MPHTRPVSHTNCILHWTVKLCFYQLQGLALSDDKFTSLEQKLCLEMSYFQIALLSSRFVSHCEDTVLMQGRIRLGWVRLRYVRLGWVRLRYVRLGWVRLRYVTLR